MISNEHEYWIVGYSQWGRWQVRKASVDDPTTYTLVEDLGPELTAAYLEADGNFTYFPGQEHLSLVTEGIPWLFVITTSGKLYVKRVAEPLENALLLDTGVLQASTCRGWKSNQYSVDSGLIVAYRKTDVVYYQTYEHLQGGYVWSGAIQLYSEGVAGVEVKRLNDFRIGFYLAGVNKLKVSDRYYIGGTAKTEFFSAEATEQFLVFATTPVSENTAFAITNVELKNGNRELWVTANYPFYSCDPNWVNDVAFDTQVASGQSIERWWLEDGLLKIRVAVPLTTAYSYMTFRIRAVNRIRFIRTPQSRPIVPEIQIVYQAPPVPYSETFKVKGTVSGMSFTMVQRHDYQQQYSGEVFQVQGTATAASVSVTPINYYRPTLEPEYFGAEGMATGCSFSETQSGVTPI